ncbi:MAG TPA: hypothetical protein VJG32_05645, partial [Anaerolineae bacterium]|nr:hypothetical protein [Anaerolineae bacterium]
LRLQHADLSAQEFIENSASSQLARQLHCRRLICRSTTAAATCRSHRAGIYRKLSVLGVSAVKQPGVVS